MREFIKRAIDVVASLTGLVVLFPVLVVVALLVLVDVGWPVFFVQLRPGLRGQVFRMYKFRTMRSLREGEALVTSDSARLTSLGRFLRSTSMDELPELLNVLRGNMSLVGPRPLLVEYLSLYSDEQSRRHDIRPGITGWAQVNGRNATSWEDRLSLDVWYVDHHSTRLDLLILVLTVRTVLLRKGIAMDGVETARRFNDQDS